MTMKPFISKAIQNLIKFKKQPKAFIVSLTKMIANRPVRNIGLIFLNTNFSGNKYILYCMKMLKTTS